jgi:predicted component of type VI protein secretion system
MGKLVLCLPDGGTREYALERERTTIGRRPDNDVCLPFPAVSGEHAAVVTILDDSFLEDLNSTNGTLVNGKAIAKHFLRDRDEIDIGRQKLVYCSGEFVGSLGADGTPRADDARGAAPRSEAPRRDPRGEGTLPLQALATPPATSGAVDTIEWFAPPESPPEHGATPVSETRAAADAPTLEVVEGPAAGTQCIVNRDAFVVGRLGVSLATLRRTEDGYRLLHLEGDVRPRINGATLPDEGSLLAVGDEIEIAGSRLLYRPAL